ncbi:MAG TPA: class II fumarate hydratase [Bryobacteraceae bacterium]
MCVPSGALYGPQTARAVENFPISRLRFQRRFIRAIALIKSCAARVNGEQGHIDCEKAARIEKVADDVAAGRYDDQFVVDVFQTGSGTSTNMNINEVIGRIANAHPNDDVNRGMSSNDSIPSAIHIAAAEAVVADLLPAMEALHEALNQKAWEFNSFLKTSRTHLQDAVPMRMGQEFSGYARQVELAGSRIEVASAGLYELALGGTASGTGLNAPKGFAAAVITEIVRRTGYPYCEAENHFEAQASKDAVVFLSAGLRNYAIALTKIANDIRWLGSGPRCGLGELKIPAVQPGSSIMPGKVNPVIAESVLMVCAQVIGYDATIAWCGAAGNFELNVMMPIMGFDLIESLELLTASSRNFADRMIAGLQVDANRTAELVEQSLAMGTALAPAIGYDRAAELVKEAFRTGKTVREVAEQKSKLDPDELARLLDPMTQAGS